MEPSPKGLRLLGYVRVSSQQQVATETVEAQRDEIKAWAKSSGVRIVGWHEDLGISGTKGAEARPGLASMMEALEDPTRKVDGVVFTVLDRLSRELVGQEVALSALWRLGQVWTTRNGRIDSDADSDPTRVLLRHLLGAVAQYERALIAGRLALGRERKRARGGFVGGGVPLGQRTVDRELAPDPSEMATVERMRSLRAEKKSYRAICAVLEAEGHRTKRGKSWTPSAVQRVLDPTARERDTAAARRASVRKARLDAEARARRDRERWIA